MPNVLGISEFVEKRNREHAEPLFQHMRNLTTILEGSSHVASRAISKGIKLYFDEISNDLWWLSTTVPKILPAHSGDNGIRIMFLNGRYRDHYGKHMPYISLEVDSGDFSSQGNDESALENLKRECPSPDDLEVMALRLPMYITHIATNELGFKFVSIKTNFDIVWMVLVKGTERLTIYVNSKQTANLIEKARENLARQSNRGPNLEK